MEVLKISIVHIPIMYVDNYTNNFVFVFSHGAETSMREFDSHLAKFIFNV